MWSASSGANNFMVTPLLPSGQSLVSTTTTSLQLAVLYNEEYSINITAYKCSGSNSTIVPLTVAGCSPPSPPANGSISEYSSGAVGAMLTFHCDTGYVPQQEVTSTCLSSGSWIPIPKCQVIDCGSLSFPVGGVIEPFSNTNIGSLIIFRCEESASPITVICSSNGEWIFNQTSIKCGNNVVLTGSGASENNDTFSTVSPKCKDTSLGSRESDTLSKETLLLITAIVCSLGFLLLGICIGGLLIYCIIRCTGKYKLASNSPAPPATSAPVILYEKVSPADLHVHTERDIELDENVAYRPVLVS